MYFDNILLILLLLILSIILAFLLICKIKNTIDNRNETNPLLIKTGGKDIDWNKIEILQPIGSGAHGDVYMIKYNKKNYALKREKILPEHVNESMDIIGKPRNEIEFYAKINTMSEDEKKYFIQLHAYRVTKCQHEHELPEFLKKRMLYDKKWAEKQDQLTKSPYCAEYLMDFAGNSLQIKVNKMMKLNNISFKKMRNITYQLLQIIKIMRKYNYVIDDFHTGNITILNGQVKIIDYGAIQPYDKNVYKYNYDLLMLVGIMINSSYFFKNYLTGIKIPPVTEHINYIKKSGYWEDICKYTQKIDPATEKIIFAVNNDVPEPSINRVLGPFVTILSSVLNSEKDTEYWSDQANINIPKVPFLLPSADLMYILDHFDDMNNLLEYFKD